MKKIAQLCFWLVICVLATSSSAESIRFAVFGDSRGRSIEEPINAQVFSTIVKEITEVNPPVRFVIFTGDLVKGTKDDAIMAKDFQMWRKLAKPFYDSDYLGAKVYAIPGNHDELNSSSYLKLWQDAFPELPDNGPSDDKKMTYSFDAGPCHFALVNTSRPTWFKEHTVDLDWLWKDLSKSEKPIKLVIGHDPAYPFVSHIGGSLDAHPSKRDEFWKILVENNVQAYFCGHVHTFHHAVKDNVHQIITGGGGAPGEPYHYLIVDADEKDVKVSLYYARDNSLRETFKLSDTKNVMVIPEPVRRTWLPYLVIGIVVIGIILVLRRKRKNIEN